MKYDDTEIYRFIGRANTLKKVEIANEWINERIASYEKREKYRTELKKQLHKIYNALKDIKIN